MSLIVVQYTALLFDQSGALYYTIIMTEDMKRSLIRIITSAESDRAAWLRSSTADSGIRRQVVADIQEKLAAFEQNNASSRWFIMPGLRGVGKTTILTQLYLDLKADPARKFFLSLERIKLLGAGMQDVLDALEELLPERLEEIKEPIYIFMDEVQYLDNWALGLKVIFDRAPKAFIVCTGSSAIDLQSSPDVARRSLTIPVRPLDFTEYASFKSHYENRPGPQPPSGLSGELRRCLLESRNYQNVFSGLSSLSGRVEEYWQAAGGSVDLVDYLHFGNLPFVFQIKDPAARWRAVNSLLDESLAKDVGRLAKRSDAVTEAFPMLLRLLAESDVISLHRISKITGFNKRTVVGMLGALCDTEILNPVKPAGSAYRQINRPSKYLFTSPTMRLALAMKAGSDDRLQAKMRGKLLEDLAGAYLKRISPGRQLHYDSRAGGADFILFDSGQAGNAIAIEVGWQKNNTDQARWTLQMTAGKYALVVTDADLDIDPAAKTVIVPLRYFLLA